METDTSSEEQFLIYQEVHDDSDQVSSVPGETNENDQDGENNIEDKGVFVHYPLF